MKSGVHELVDQLGIKQPPVVLTVGGYQLETRAAV
jgi:hypothetical protein